MDQERPKSGKRFRIGKNLCKNLLLSGLRRRKIESFEVLSGGFLRTVNLFLLDSFWWALCCKCCDNFLCFVFRQGMEISREAGMVMENKRSLCSLEESSLGSLSPKRHRSDLSFSSKERKDRVGERISALQQIVSPYGKTDTASVLLEAMQYIQFLHEQVKVLSAPYLLTNPEARVHEEMEHYYSLRNRGLCLVPISYTSGVSQSNGADIWAPVKTPPPPPAFGLRSHPPPFQ